MHLISPFTWLPFGPSLSDLIWPAALLPFQEFVLQPKGNKKKPNMQHRGRERRVWRSLGPLVSFLSVPVSCLIPSPLLAAVCGFVQMLIKKKAPACVFGRQSSLHHRPSLAGLSGKADPSCRILDCFCFLPAGHQHASLTTLTAVVWQKKVGACLHRCTAAPLHEIPRYTVHTVHLLEGGPMIPSVDKRAVGGERPRKQASKAKQLSRRQALGIAE